MPSYPPTAVYKVSPKRRPDRMTSSLGDDQTLLVQSKPKCCNILLFTITDFMINSFLLLAFLSSSPCISLGRPRGFQGVKQTTFHGSRHTKVVTLSALRIPGTRTTAGIITSMKNSNDTIRNRTRDLPACSAVPQQTAPPSVFWC